MKKEMWRLKVKWGKGERKGSLFVKYICLVFCLKCWLIVILIVLFIVEYLWCMNKMKKRKKIKEEK